MAQRLVYFVSCIGNPLKLDPLKLGDRMRKRHDAAVANKHYQKDEIHYGIED